MVSGASTSLRRCCLAAGVLLWPRALAQPICNVLGAELKAEAAAHSKCSAGSFDELMPSTRRLAEDSLMNSWTPASIYRAAARHPSFEASSASALLQTLDAHSPLVSVGSGDLPAADFQPVAPASQGTWANTWANTPEGEWMVRPFEASSPEPGFMARTRGNVRINLEDAEGNCTLAGVSVYKTAPRTVLVRLNFDGCNHASGVRHAAVVVPIHATVYGSSRLVDWMCALMPHETCFQKQEMPTTTLAPGVVALEMAAKYLPLSYGQCAHATGRKYTHARAVTLGECAQECLSENTFATRDVGGTNCTGFAFSADGPEHCIIYMDSPVVVDVGSADTDPWRCYYMLKAKGDASHTRYAGVSQEELKAKARETIGLSLRTDVGVKGMAVRRRLMSIAPGCYKPFDWIDLSHASKHSSNTHFGLPITLNNTIFQRLVEKLPVVESAGREHGDGSTAIGTDSVCVDAGTGACRRGDVDLQPYLILFLVGALCLAAGVLLGRHAAKLGLCGAEDTSDYLQIEITNGQGKVLSSRKGRWTQN